MTEPHLDPPAMVGDGFYNLHSRQQAEAAEVTLDVLRRGMSTLPRDLFSDDGRRLRRIAGRQLDAADRGVHQRARSRSQAPLTVVHTDQPSNDWTTLFDTVYDAPFSYLRGATDIFPQAVGRTFYDQVLPDASVIAGWSSTAALGCRGGRRSGPGTLELTVVATGTARSCSSSRPGGGCRAGGPRLGGGSGGDDGADVPADERRDRGALATAPPTSSCSSTSGRRPRPRLSQLRRARRPHSVPPPTPSSPTPGVGAAIVGSRAVDDRSAAAAAAASNGLSLPSAPGGGARRAVTATG